MIIGYHSFSDRRFVSNNNLYSSNINHESFFINYEEAFLYKYDQLILLKNKDHTIQVTNRNRFGNQLIFENFIDFQRFISKQKRKNSYSYILFDLTDKSVTFNRDIFGICPYYYRLLEDGSIYFSSNLSKLIHPLLPKSELNPHIINKYFDWRTDVHSYTKETFFKNIFNVLPGHTFKYSKDIFHENSSVSTILGSENKSTLGEIGEETNYLLAQSIKSLIGNYSKIACHLSGGLDSSSVAGVLRQIEPYANIDTFYIDTKTPLTEEKLYAESVADFIKSKHHNVNPFIKEFETTYINTKILGHPEFMINGSAMYKSLTENIASTNCDIVLTGLGGDAIIGYGSEYITEKFKNQEWRLLKELLQSKNYEKLGYLNNSSKKHDYYKTIYSLLASNKHSTNNIEKIISIYKAAIFFDVPFTFFFNQIIRKLGDLKRLPDKNISIGPMFLERSTIKHLGTPVKNCLQDQNGVFDYFPLSVNEQLYNLSFIHNVQHVFPFFEENLYNYCLTVPNELKYDNGKRRGHLREAVKNVIPEKVRTRTTKGNFGEYGRLSALNLLNQSQDLLTPKSSIWNYVKRSQFNLSVNLLKSKNQELYVYNRCQFNVFKTINLAIWLDLYH